MTEQYPKGLGPTVSDLGAEDLKPHTKTCFSMLTESVENELKSLGSPKQAILCGIEAQACIAVINSIFLVSHSIYAYRWTEESESLFSTLFAVYDI